MKYFSILGAFLACVILCHAETDRIFRGICGPVKDVKELHGNSLFVWGLPASGSDAFNAKIKEIRQWHKDGFTVFVNGPTPFKSDKSLYSEKDGRKTLAIDYDYTPGPFMDRYLKAYKEIASVTIPAVINIAPDEITWNNAHTGYTFGCPIDSNMPYYCASKAQKKGFKENTGLEFPEITVSRLLKENSKANRQFILFRYQALADAFARVQKSVKEINPEFQTYMMLNQAPIMGLERYHAGVALDILGETFTPDFLSSTVFHLCEDYRGNDTHYQAAETVNHLAAANPKTKIMPFTACMKWGESFNGGKGAASAPKTVIGQIPYSSLYRAIDMTCINLSAVAHGADGVSMFGYANTMEPKVKRAVKRGFLALEKAEPWLAGSEVPGDIVLLYSRAGEDFYALANENPKLDAVADGSMAIREMGGWVQPCNSLTAFLGKHSPHTLGFRSQKQVIYFLFKNGLPFKMHYLDNLREEELKGARLVILPFAHAMSQETKDILDRARQNGASILVFSQRGEVDQEGEPYPVPLLTSWVEKLPDRGAVCCGLRIAYVPDIQAAVRINSRPLSTNIQATVKALLQNKLPLALDKAEEAEIEAALRKKSDADQTVVLINWDEEFRPASFGLDLPSGEYKVEIWDVLASKCKDNLKSLYSHEDLKKFKLDFSPGQAYIVHVVKNR